MANTTAPELTFEQQERLLKAEWGDLLLKLSGERAIAAQTELDENLDGLQDFHGESLARYRLSIYNAHLDYWRAVVKEGYIPHAEQYRK